MKTSPIRRTLASTAILIAAALPCLAEPPEAEKTDWLRVETTNFTLLSNAGKRRAAAFGKKLEQLREVLTETSKGMSFKSPLPTTIFVFKDEASFAPYHIGADGKPTNDAGYFARSFDGNYVALDGSIEPSPYGVIFHEYLHYVLENSLPEVPLWLNEGLAEFYRTFQIRGGHADLGLAPPEHLLWLSSHAWLSLDTLFAVDTASKHYNEAERQGTFYAQSWLVAHHLLLDPRRRDRMGKFLALIEQGTPSVPAFEHAFQVDLVTAEGQLREYFAEETNRFLKYTPKEDFDEQSARVTPLSQRDVHYHLGDLLSRHAPIQFAAAERHLRDALALDETFVDAQVALAALRLEQDQPAQAAELCVKALSADPAHGRALVVHGASLMAQYAATVDESTPRPEAPPPLLIQAREQFRKRLAQSPDDMDALAALGQTYAFDREQLDPGLDALRRAFQARPARTDLLAGLIALTARSGNIDGARELLLKRLRPRGNAEATELAEAELTDVRMARAEELYNQGEIDRALELAKQAAEDLSDPDRRRKLSEWIAQAKLHQQADQLSRQANEAAMAGDEETARRLRGELLGLGGHGDEGAQALATYNQAIALANAGEFEKAAELFDQVLTTAAPPQIKTLAEAHAKELREVAASQQNVLLFNQAVEALNARDLKTATTLLEQLLGRHPGGEIQQEAERMLRDVQRGRR